MKSAEKRLLSLQQNNLEKCREQQQQKNEILYNSVQDKWMLSAVLE